MISWLKRCAMEGEDRLRYSPRVRRWLSDWAWLRHAYARPDDDQARARSIRALCAAARLAPPGEGLRRMGRIHEQETILGPPAAEPCQEGQATNQIGCLVQADPCSVGFAGDGARTLPGADALRISSVYPTPQTLVTNQAQPPCSWISS